MGSRRVANSQGQLAILAYVNEQVVEIRPDLGAKMIKRQVHSVNQKNHLGMGSSARYQPDEPREERAVPSCLPAFEPTS